METGANRDFQIKKPISGVVCDMRNRHCRHHRRTPGLIHAYSDRQLDPEQNLLGRSLLFDLGLTVDFLDSPKSTAMDFYFP